MSNTISLIKKIAYLLLIATVVGLLAAGIVFSQLHNNKRVCSAIQVDFTDNDEINFLTEKEIVAKIYYKAGGKVIGKPLVSLDLNTIEKEIYKSNYVQDCKIYFNQKDEMIVQIKQNIPILRIINNDGVSYYLSENKVKMPLCSNFTPNVPIAVGDVMIRTDIKRDSIVLSQLYDMAKTFEADTVLNALIDYVAVQKNGELEMFPKFGKHTIFFGSYDNDAPLKWRNLKAFYRDVMGTMGWDKYVRINLKYKNQIVGEKPEEIAVNTTINDNQNSN